MITIRFRLKLLYAFVLSNAVFFWAFQAQAAPVSEKEALEIAAFWHSAEVNLYYKKGWKRDYKKKDPLLYETPISRVQYLVGRDNLVDKVKNKHDVLAYIVEFDPKGNVVISADDTFSPLLAFSIDSIFDFEDNPLYPGQNFMRYFLNRFSDAAEIALDKKASKKIKDEPLEAWTNLRSNVQTQQDLLPEEQFFVQYAASGDQTAMGGTPDPTVSEILLETALWYQDGFYNDYFDELVLGYVPNNFMRSVIIPIPPDFPNCVPTGCNATALAIILRYHEWPVVGSGTHEHYDEWGNTHAGGEINFGNVTYNWSNMPTYNINTTPPPNGAPNDDIAQLMYHAGMIMEQDWEATPLKPGTAGYCQYDEINDHLRYKDTELIEAYDDTGSPGAFCTHEWAWDSDYFFCESDQTWSNASAACSSLDATMALVDIVDEYENEFIKNKLIANGMTNAWIGASDSVTEGTWIWDRTGAALNYTNWAAGEPNSEDCAYMDAADGTWTASSCAVQRYYVCKRPVHSAILNPHIEKNISGGLPVFTGVPNHGFVIDGYRAPNLDPSGTYFHMNLGWGGDSNDWYTENTVPAPADPLITGICAYQTPINFMYVDVSHSGTKNGSLKNPYDTILQGANNIPVRNSQTNPDGGHLWIKAGFYSGSGNAPISISKTMEISNYRGDVNIDGKLHMKNNARILIGRTPGTLDIQ